MKPLGNRRRLKAPDLPGPFTLPLIMPEHISFICWFSDCFGPFRFSGFIYALHPRGGTWGMLPRSIGIYIYNQFPFTAFSNSVTVSAVASGHPWPISMVHRPWF